MTTLYSFLIPLQILLIYAAIRPGFRKATAREPKRWQILFATFLVLFAIGLLKTGVTFMLLLGLIALAVATSWTYAWEKRHQKKAPLLEDIRYAISYSEKFPKDVESVTSILRTHTWSRKNIEILQQLLNSGQLNEAICIGLENISSGQTLYIASFQSLDKHQYIALLHDSANTLGLDITGIWKQTLFE